MAGRDSDSGALPASRFLASLVNPPAVSARWNGFSIHLFDPPSQATVTFADHVVALHLAGTGRLRREIGGRAVRGWFTPGTMNLVPADVPATWTGSGGARAVVLAVSPGYLARVIEEGWGRSPGSVEVVGQFLVRDPVIETLLTRLAFEVRNGSPSGQLYAESASEFLAHHILHTYSSLAGPPPKFAGGLAGHRLKTVQEYVEATLAQPISLHRLAELAGVGPRHFERAFRQALGVPPHAYVLQRRIAVARHLLLTELALSVQEIAARTGFSSASHLAFAFRRQTGCSPLEYRRLRSR